MSINSTPILLLGFNRPDCVAQLVASLREHKPRSLYIAVDGPRVGNELDVIACAATLEEFRRIDWIDSIQWLIREQNLGCGRAVSEAISWFFSYVEEGIILEDDCIPGSDFLTYASRLLDVYREDIRVSTISGDAFFPSCLGLKQPFWFSKYAQIWGWATWRRAWEEYDYSLESLSTEEWMNVIREHNPNPQEQTFWLQILEDLTSGKLDTWDYQLTFSAWKLDRLHIMPSVNLVTNIGFRADATHTRHESVLHGAASECLQMEELRPLPMTPNAELDDLVFYRRWLESLRFTWWIEKPIAAKYEHIVELNRYLTKNADGHDSQLKEMSASIAAERKAFQERIDYLEGELKLKRI